MAKRTPEAYMHTDHTHNQFERTKAILIHSLREFYRRHYLNGESDESFILWIEDIMHIAYERTTSTPTNKEPQQ